MKNEQKGKNDQEAKLPPDRYEQIPTIEPNSEDNQNRSLNKDH